jgi:cob(I)alamin adenosyltransferase
MKLYTKTGDKGTSSLYNGERVAKSNIYFKLLGDLDELNSHIGMSKSLWKNKVKGLYSGPGAGGNIYRHEPSVDTGLYYEWYDTEILTEVQCIIMDISSLIATPPWSSTRPVRGEIEKFIETWKNRVGFDETRIKSIETFIDRLDSLVEPITNFIVPGNDVLVSSIHICRTVARRCERSFIEFVESDLKYLGVYEPIDTEYRNLQIYLNRLSDMFFALSRFIAMSLDVTEECYSKRRNVFPVLS